MLSGQSWFNQLPKQLLKRLPKNLISLYVQTKSTKYHFNQLPKWLPKRLPKRLPKWLPNQLRSVLSGSNWYRLPFEMSHLGSHFQSRFGILSNCAIEQFNQNSQMASETLSTDLSCFGSNFGSRFRSHFGSWLKWYLVDLVYTYREIKFLGSRFGSRFGSWLNQDCPDSTKMPLFIMGITDLRFRMPFQKPFWEPFRKPYRNLIESPPWPPCLP